MGAAGETFFERSTSPGCSHVTSVSINAVDAFDETQPRYGSEVPHAPNRANSPGPTSPTSGWSEVQVSRQNWAMLPAVSRLMSGQASEKISVPWMVPII